MTSPVISSPNSPRLSSSSPLSSPAHSKSSSSYRPRPISSDRPLDGSMHFTILRHPSEAFEVMNVLRHSRKLCDVTLIVEEERFDVHKLVLASCSPYFKAMFTGGLRECRMDEIPLQGISPCTLSMLIDFAYTSEIHINEMNVSYLLPAATMFQMQHVVEACCTFLENQLDPSNCIGISDFANEHGCQELNKKARQYIYEHFTEVCKHEEFMQLNACQLIQLIKRDELNVNCESEVYDAVLAWVKYEERNRRPKLEQLLAGVRCVFLTPNFLRKQIQQCEILKSNQGCKDYLSRIFKDLTLHKKMPAGVARRHPAAPLVIYSAGGYLRHSLSNMECYYPRENTWTRLEPLALPRSGLGAAMVRGLFYAIGGRNNSPDGNQDSHAVDCFDPSTNLWHTCSSMSAPRNRVGVGVIDDLIYAVGGSHGSTHHQSVERYEPTEDVWSPVTSMATRRIGVGVAVVNRLLYAVGGFDGQKRLNSVECYTPETNSWHFVASMNTTRSGAGVCAIDNLIYAVGGYDGSSQLRTVERYDIEMDEWTFIAPMKFPRSALSVAVVEGSLFALGGYDGADFLASVEYYNFEKDDWEEVTHMSCGRSGHGVAVGVESSWVAKGGASNASSTLVDMGGAVVGVGGTAGGGASGAGSVRVRDLVVDDILAS